MNSKLKNGTDRCAWCDLMRRVHNPPVVTSHVFKEFKPCASVRPPRKVLCQREQGHKGSCRAVIYWEK